MENCSASVKKRQKQKEGTTESIYYNYAYKTPKRPRERFDQRAPVMKKPKPAKSSREQYVTSLQLFELLEFQK